MRLLGKDFDIIGAVDEVGVFPFANSPETTPYEAAGKLIRFQPQACIGFSDMDVTQLEKALEPFEKRLRAQEKFRRRLGVKEVDRPTYERYVIGPIERFDSRKNAFALMTPDNPFGSEFREAYERRTGIDHFSNPLPQEGLAPEDRPGQALAQASSIVTAQAELRNA